MFEYENGKNSASSNSFITTSSGPRVKKVTVTEYVYDKDGNILKETCTETEYTDGSTWIQNPVYPTPYYPGITWTSSTGYSVPGEGDDTPLK